MKYFTEEIWSGINFDFGKEKTEHYHEVWADNTNKYFEVLSSISGRLNVKAYKYFSAPSCGSRC